MTCRFVLVQLVGLQVVLILDEAVRLASCILLVRLKEVFLLRGIVIVIFDHDSLVGLVV